MSIFDSIIVGAGPAGMTAALYLRRADKKVLIIEKETCGGQMALAPCIENFPSVEKVVGSELANKMLTQILNLDVDLELEEVLKIEKKEDLFYVTTDYNNYVAKSVIIATGAKHRMMGIPNEEEWIGKGISYCVSCDGAFFKGEKVAVIGDGNSALQYALELSSYCPKVYICTLFNKFFGDKVLIDRLKNKENIEIIENVSLKNVKGLEKLETLVFENTITKEEVNLNVRGCFIAIGQVPSNGIIKDLAEIDKAGYAVTNESLNTKTEGLFVAGDCRTKNVRQVATAVADGAVAATQVVRFLN